MSGSDVPTQRALVTGGAGFIGSHIVDRLVREGWEVRVLDDFSSGCEANLVASRGAFELLRGDVGDAALLQRAVEDIDVVFHLAAIASVGRSIEEPERTSEVNIGGTLALLEAARCAGVKRLIFASSAAVYGDSDALPCVESQPADCLSPYALQKHTSERYLSLYSRMHAIEAVSLRCFNVYGPRQSLSGDYASVIPLFVRAALADQPIRICGDGAQTRDFVFIDDVVEANLLAAATKGLSDTVLNVASGEQTSVNRLVETIEECMGRSLVIIQTEARVGEVRYSWSDVGRAHKQLGYTPKISLQDGLTRTIEAFGRREV